MHAAKKYTYLALNVSPCYPQTKAEFSIWNTLCINNVVVLPEAKCHLLPLLYILNILI